jgi:glutathione S-transferase
MGAILYSIHYSTWSIKARWALAHHGVEYEKIEFIPTLSNAALRVRTRQWTGPLTVPVLIDESGVYGDSFDIARRAEAIGGGAPLLPDDLHPEIEAWNTHADNTLATHGRIAATAAVCADRDARRASVPGFIPKPLRSLALTLVDVASHYLARKYGFRVGARAPAVQAMRGTLEGVRDALAGRPYLLERFTLADVSLASALQFVQPVSDDYIPLKPAFRRAWEVDELIADFGPVLEWRDRVFAAHFPTRH